MNTLTSTIRIIAIAAVAATLVAPVAVRAAEVSAPQTVVVNGISIPVAHQGPGAGSVKSAPFTWLASAPSTVAPMSFHAASAVATAAQHVGPGIGSVKSPAAR